MAQVTPQLWAEEARGIVDSNKDLDKLTVRVRPSVREVIAAYALDDGCSELVVTLPKNFPLGMVKVESGSRVGVGHVQWRTWLLQLTTFLQVRDRLHLHFLTKPCDLVLRVHLDYGT